MVSTFWNKNNVIVYDIDTGTKIKEIGLKNTRHINDFLFCFGDVFLNQIYLIALTDGKKDEISNIKIIDLDKGIEIITKEISSDSHCSSTIIKTVVSSKKESEQNQKKANSYKESLVVFLASEEEEDSKIILYEF